MNGNKERVAILYCERAFDSKNFAKGYEAESWMNVDCILDRYSKIAGSVMDPPRLDAGVSAHSEGPLLEFSGSPGEVEKAVKKILGNFAMPPETRIVPPGKYGEYEGSSEGGYRIARKIAAGMGHRVRKSGEILLRKLEAPA